MAGKRCGHINGLTEIRQPQERVCSECMKMGGQWVHLRTCQTCGVTLCCDSSLHRHARHHAEDTGHPVIASAEPGEYWLYCYPDDAFGAYKAPAGD